MHKKIIEIKKERKSDIKMNNLILFVRNNGKTIKCWKIGICFAFLTWPLDSSAELD